MTYIKLVCFIFDFITIAIIISSILTVFLFNNLYSLRKKNNIYLCCELKSDYLRHFPSLIYLNDIGTVQSQQISLFACPQFFRLFKQLFYFLRYLF